MLKSLFTGLLCVSVVLSPVHAKKSKTVTTPKPAAVQIEEPLAYLVYDLDAKKALYQKSVKLVRPVASLTKLLTAITFLNESTEEFRRTGSMYLDPAQDLDTLKGTMLRMSLVKPYSITSLFQLSVVNSNNNATYALSRAIPGMPRTVFMAKMNATAAKLQMTHSFFEEPTGLSAKNVSNIEDLLKLALAARTRPEITDLAKYSYVVEEGSSRTPVLFKNTNKLTTEDHIPAVLSKTGYIKEAGFNLIFEPHPQVCRGSNYLIIVLGAKNAPSRKAFMHNVLKQVKCSIA